MRTGFLFGRLIAGIYFLYAGLNGFLHFQMLLGFAASKGVPSPEVAVLVSHALLLFAGFSLLTGFQPLLGISALVLFLIPVSFMMHAFWLDRDPQARAIDMLNFTKNMGLVGSSLMFLAIPRPWPASLDHLIRTGLPRGTGGRLPVHG